MAHSASVNHVPVAVELPQAEVRRGWKVAQYVDSAVRRRRTVPCVTGIERPSPFTRECLQLKPRWRNKNPLQHKLTNSRT